MRLEAMITTLTEQIMNHGKGSGRDKGELDVLESLLTRIKNMVGDGIQSHELETLGRLLGQAGDQIDCPELKQSLEKVEKKLKFLKDTGLLELIEKNPQAAGMVDLSKVGHSTMIGKGLTSDAIPEIGGVNMGTNPFEQVDPHRLNDLFNTSKTGVDNEQIRAAGSLYKEMRREIAEDTIQALLTNSMNRVMGIKSLL